MIMGTDDMLARTDACVGDTCFRTLDSSRDGFQRPPSVHDIVHEYNMLAPERVRSSVARLHRSEDARAVVIL